MDFQTLKNIISEKKLTKAELKKREEIAQAIAKEHPEMDMSKKMAIATSTAKKCCEDTIEEELLDEISPYDLVVTFMRQKGLDPYSLRGKAGQVIRDRIKNSPGYKAWIIQRYKQPGMDIQPKKIRYESVESVDEFYITEAKSFRGLSGKFIKKEAEKYGFVADRKKGSHVIYKHPESKLPHNVSIPDHDEVADGLAANLYKQMGQVLFNLGRVDTPKLVPGGSKIKPVAEEKIEKIMKAFKKKPDITFYNTGISNKDKPSSGDTVNTDTCG